jgi:hypothetical protein
VTVLQYLHLSLLSSFKDRSGSTHLWPNCVIYICVCAIIILDKTYTENCFLTVAEEVLRAEDPACVLCDGTQFFGVTIGNLSPTRF